MDAGALLSTDQLTQDVEATVAALKSLPRRAGVSELLMPGERGDLCQAQAQKIGLGLPEETWVDVQRSAEKFGISLPKST
jgi:LDH2 family malate/lactate/ureidoglycolate dehydrogenase